MRAKKKGIILAVLLLVLLTSVLKNKFLSKRHSHSARTEVPDADVNSVQTGNSLEHLDAVSLWVRPEPVLDINDPTLLLIAHQERMIDSGSKGDLAVTSGVTKVGDTRGTPVQLDESMPVFWVKGIIYSRMDRSTVILEEGILRKGDTIYGATVTEVLPHDVEFEKNGKVYRVRVGQKGSDPDVGPDNKQS